jgi:hypothetical protein
MAVDTPWRLGPRKHGQFSAPSTGTNPIPAATTTAIDINKGNFIAATLATPVRSGEKNQLYRTTAALPHK